MAANPEEDTVEVQGQLDLLDELVSKSTDNEADERGTDRHGR